MNQHHKLVCEVLTIGVLAPGARSVNRTLDPLGSTIPVTSRSRPSSLTLLSSDEWTRRGAEHSKSSCLDELSFVGTPSLLTQMHPLRRWSKPFIGYRLFECRYTSPHPQNGEHISVLYLCRYFEICSYHSITVRSVGGHNSTQRLKRLGLCHVSGVCSNPFTGSRMRALD